MARISAILVLATFALSTLVSTLNPTDSPNYFSLNRRRKGHKQKAPENLFVPGEGVVRYPAGVSVEEAYKMSDKSKSQKGYIFTVVANNSTEKVCIFAERTDLTTNVHKPLNLTGSGILLAPNETVQLGNIANTKNNLYNGIYYSRTGCDDDCNNCPGPKPDIYTLAEWTYDARSKDVSLWSDLSSVNGLNNKFNFTIMSTAGVCQRLSCWKSKEEVKELCPEMNYWEDGDAWGCQSDCKVTRSDDDCGINAGAGKQSSLFFRDICPHSYAYATDDTQREVVHACKGKKKARAMIVEIW